MWFKTRPVPGSAAGQPYTLLITHSSPRATMIDGSAPHRVFKIGELTRLIARQLIPDGQESAVDLACACRSLEEPVLSTVWETQDSLCTLLEVLPRDTWE